jgi:hypothetical protein
VAALLSIQGRPLPPPCLPEHGQSFCGKSFECKTEIFKSLARTPRGCARGSTTGSACTSACVVCLHRPTFVPGSADCGASFTALNWAAARLAGLPPQTDSAFYGSKPKIYSLGVDGRPQQLPSTEVRPTSQWHLSKSSTSCPEPFVQYSTEPWHIG